NRVPALAFAHDHVNANEVDPGAEDWRLLFTRRRLWRRLLLLLLLLLSLLRLALRRLLLGRRRLLCRLGGLSLLGEPDGSSESQKREGYNTAAKKSRRFPSHVPILISICCLGPTPGARGWRRWRLC